MGLIGRDVYEIIVRDEGANASLRALNDLVEEDRRRWDRLATTLDKVDKAFDKGARSAEDAGRGLSKTTSSLLSLDAATSLVAKSWGALRRAGDALAKPIGLAQSFETEVAALDTISNQAGTRLRGTFLDLSERLGRDAADVGRTAYEAVSSGVADATVAQFTEISGKLATAGRAELLPTLRVLTTFQNQFGLSVEGVAHAADVLFAATKVGVTTIPELASELGDVIPLAKGAGLGIESLSGAIAALTKGGLTTALAATQVKSLATSLLTDVPKVVVALNEAGVSITEADFKALSFRDRMVLLSKTFTGAEGPLIKAFGRIEGVSAALALGANNAAFFDEAMTEIAKSTGATDAAFSRFAQTSAFTSDQLRATFGRQLIELGDTLLPLVNELLREGIEYLKANGPALASTIKSGVEALVSMGRFIVDNGEAILTFFGLLAGAKVVSGIGSLVASLSAAATTLGSVASAAGVVGGAIGLLTGPVGLAIAAFVTLKDVAREAGEWIGKSLTLGAEAVNQAQNIQNILLGAQVNRAVGDFGTVDALNAQRNAVLGGDAVLIDPADLDAIRGQFTAKTSDAFASLQEVLALGVDEAQVIVEANIGRLNEAASIQTQRFEEAKVKLDDALAAQAQADADVKRLQSDLGAQLTGTLTEAVNKQRQIAEQVRGIQAEAAFFERRGLQFADAAAALADKFTGALGAQASPQGAAAATTTVKPPKPTGRGGKADDGLALEAQLEREAAAAALRIQAADDANRERRAKLIEDDNARQLALLDLRFEQERRAAEAAGQDLLLLTQVQGRERLQVIADQERAAAQERTQAQADFITELERIKQVEATILAGTDEGAIIALQNRQEQEIALVQGSLEAEAALRTRHEEEMSILIAEQNAARLQTLAGYAEGVGSILGDIAGVMRAFGVESKVLAGIEILADAAALQAKAISAFAEAGIEAAKGNVFKATALVVAAGAAQAQVVALGIKAAQLGASGGTGGRGASTAGARRTPRAAAPRGGDGTGETRQVFIFQGDVYDTRREAEAAFGRRAIRGIDRLGSAPRTAGRADFAGFQR